MKIRIYQSVTRNDWSSKPLYVFFHDEAKPPEELADGWYCFNNWNQIWVTV